MGFYSASFLQKEHFKREYMGCQACGRLLSHLWFTDLASEIFRISLYNTGCSVLKLLIEIHIGLCSKWSTSIGDRMAINKKKLEACKDSFGMLMFNSCSWLLHNSFIFHKNDEFHGHVIFTAGTSSQSTILFSLGLWNASYLFLKWPNGSISKSFLLIVKKYFKCGRYKCQCEWDSVRRLTMVF